MKRIVFPIMVSLTAIAVLVGSALPVWASVSISPAFVDVDLEKGRPSGQFEITNNGDVEQRYRINSIHFMFLKEGGMREIPPDERSLAPWVKFNPKEFVLPPKMKQIIRFVITPKGRLQPGEYWAAMELESLKTAVGQTKTNDGQQFRLEVIPSIIIPIFGRAGSVSYRGEISEAKITSSPAGKVIQASVSNTGNGRLFVTGEYELADAEGKILEKGSLGHGYVLRGMERSFAARLKSIEKEKEIRISYHAAQLDKPLQKSLPSKAGTP